MNASPSHLFDRLLADRRASSRASDWYAEVVPEAFQELWTCCRADADLAELPERVTDLNRDHRKAASRALKGRSWPSEQTTKAYQWLAVDVSNRSAKRWLAAISDDGNREEMLWRLLRFAAAPYFVLGAAHDGTALHYRVATPWDFRQRYELNSFDAWGDAVGQPVVKWRADVTDRTTGAAEAVEGHIEVRWSHGRFGGMPEAKIYLDTPHHQVPGYLPLTIDVNS